MNGKFLSSERVNHSMKIALGLALAGAVAFPAVTQAATNLQKQTAIDNGLKYLATSQNLSTGAWDYGYDGTTGTTASALLAFLEKGYTLGNDVIIGGTNYGKVVDKGLNYLLGNVQQVNLGSDPSPPTGGNPYTNQNIGTYWGGGEQIYNTGLVASTLSQVPGSTPITTGSFAGKTYQDLLKSTVDYFAWGQLGPNRGNYQGGWRYAPASNQDTADNSTSQWPVIGSLFAQQAGIATPQILKDELAHWIGYIQNANGGSGYDSPGNLVNEAKTGGLLLEMLLAQKDTNSIPYDLNNADLQAALNYININWQNTAPYGSQPWDGNFAQPYAMWGIYKGLQGTIGLTDTTHITNLKTGGPGLPNGACGLLDSKQTCNWWENYSEYLVNTQQGNGQWPDYSYWTGPLTAAWNISILSATKIVPPPPKNVPEPSGNVALLGLGLLGLGVTVRKNLRRQ